MRSDWAPIGTIAGLLSALALTGAAAAQTLLYVDDDPATADTGCGVPVVVDMGA